MFSIRSAADDAKRVVFVSHVKLRIDTGPLVRAVGVTGAHPCNGSLRGEAAVP
jgi:hypothetical protein